MDIKVQKIVHKSVPKDLKLVVKTNYGISKIEHFGGPDFCDHILDEKTLIEHLAKEDILSPCHLCNNSYLKKIGVRTSTIRSHTHGKIVSDTKNDNEITKPLFNRKIRIYIDREDNHEIYAPATGRITNISEEHGKFKTVSPYTKKFKSDDMHTGRIYFFMSVGICFAVEVGKPQYITDTVSLDIEEGDQIEIGKKIGEILIGSTSYIFYNDTEYDFIQRSGTVVSGGNTVLLESK